MKRQLSESECSIVALALRMAVAQFQADANEMRIAGQDGLRVQFQKQAEEAAGLAEAIENAEEVLV